MGLYLWKEKLAPERLTLPQQKAFIWPWQPVGYSMGLSKHAVYTNPIQAAERIEGILSKPLSEVNEAFILLTSLPHPPKDLDWPYRDSNMREGPRGYVTQPQMKVTVRESPSDNEQTSRLQIQDLWGRECGRWGRRKNLCPNYIHKKALLFQSFFMLKWATLMYEQGADVGGNSIWQPPH